MKYYVGMLGPSLVWLYLCLVALARATSYSVVQMNWFLIWSFGVIRLWSLPPNLFVRSEGESLFNWWHPLGYLPTSFFFWYFPTGCLSIIWVRSEFRFWWSELMLLMLSGAYLLWSSSLILNVLITSWLWSYHWVLSAPIDRYWWLVPRERYDYSRADFV